MLSLIAPMTDESGREGNGVPGKRKVRYEANACSHAKAAPPLRRSPPVQILFNFPSVGCGRVYQGHDQCSASIRVTDDASDTFLLRERQARSSVPFPF